MKKVVQLILSVSVLFVFQTGKVSAQWCVPTTLIPYDANMPGITNVTIGTINRTSLACEHYPNNNYTNTGLSTNLARGVTYTISITHIVDAAICPDMNLRVWIDYNQNHAFDTTTETVITTNHHLPGTYTSTFTVPATATLGATRMRVVAKMSDLGGHIFPSPCDIPQDPAGYHGEMEDYTVNIVAGVGINDLAQESAIVVFPNPASTTINISPNQQLAGNCTLSIINILGEKVFQSEIVNPKSEIHLDIPNGIYFYELQTEREVIGKGKLVIQK
jgi:hypothetical protein